MTTKNLKLSAIIMGLLSLAFMNITIEYITRNYLTLPSIVKTLYNAVACCLWLIILYGRLCIELIHPDIMSLPLDTSNDRDLDKKIHLISEEIYKTPLNTLIQRMIHTNTFVGIALFTVTSFILCFLPLAEDLHYNFMLLTVFLATNILTLFLGVRRIKYKSKSE